MDEISVENTVHAISDQVPPAQVAKKRNVRRKKRADVLDEYEFLAETFGKTLVAPVSALPADACWYAWKGPADAAAMFFDTRKFERFNQIAKLLTLPKEATGGCVFF